jgi:hypothetical protein
MTSLAMFVALDRPEPPAPPPPRPRKFKLRLVMLAAVVPLTAVGAVFLLATHMTLGVALSLARWARS